MGNSACQDPPREETIEGKKVRRWHMGVNHSIVEEHIACQFANYLEGKDDMPFMGINVILDDDNDYIPDVSIVCDRSMIGKDGIYGAPDFVAEVLSRLSVQNDRGPKMRHYAAAGVKEYWIVSPIGKTVEVYYNENGSFVLDAAYTIYDELDLSRMDDDERKAIRWEIPVSLYKDFRVNINDVFKDLIVS